MKLLRFFTCAAVFALMACASAAYADGMPFKEPPPEPVLTPLDKALNEIENTEPPVDVTQSVEQTEPPAAEPPAPVVVLEEPKPAPPVPAARVVEVQPDSSFFGLSVGMYDPFTHGRNAASFNLEWQPGVKIAGVVQPLFGAIVTTKGSLMGYGGLGLPINIGPRVMFMPSVAVGAYEEGDGFDLGQALAFRVGGELAYVFDDKSRLGLNAHVITNGRSLGRSDRTEIIGLAYTTPLDAFGGMNRGPGKTAPLANDPARTEMSTPPAPEENTQTIQ